MKFENRICSSYAFEKREIVLQDPRALAHLVVKKVSDIARNVLNSSGNTE